MIEITYGFVKPDAYGRRDDIKALIRLNGLDVVAEKFPYVFDRRTAEKHYEAHRGKPFFDGLMEFVMSGATDQLIISGEDAVRALRRLTGETDSSRAYPGTIRDLFGDKKDITKNAFHASDTKRSAKVEISVHWSWEEIERHMPEVLAILEKYH